MEPKRKIRPWHFVIGIFLLVLFLVLGTCTAGVLSPIPYLHLYSFKGKVIDADTKEPISGAAVLAVYYKSTSWVAGSNSYTVDGQETLTDENGEFDIPETRRWFVSHRGYTESNLIIFKPGYGAFPEHKLSVAVGENKTWPPPEKYVEYELPKLETREERIRAVIDVDIEYDMQFAKQKIMVETINEEFKNLGLAKRYIEKDGKPIMTLVR